MRVRNAELKPGSRHLTPALSPIEAERVNCGNPPLAPPGRGTEVTVRNAERPSDVAAHFTGQGVRSETNPPLTPPGRGTAKGEKHSTSNKTFNAPPSSSKPAACMRYRQQMING